MRSHWGLALVIFAVAGCHCLLAQARERTTFDFDWRFHKGDVAGAEVVTFDDSQWRALDLPHDFSIEGTIDEAHPSGRRMGWYETGVCWYRKSFDVPADWDKKAVTLFFDGAYMNSTVWVNGHKVGGRPYGYISFHFDISEHLKPGKNVVAMRLDNEAQPSSRWYTGTGIYRHVWLIATDRIHVPVWGAQILTPEITEERATVSAVTQIVNESGETKSVTITTTILDPDGERVARHALKNEAAAGQSEVTQELFVPGPRLWDLDSPALYQAKTTIASDGKTLDEVATNFGFRTIEWDAERGMILNGVPTKLKGVCNHHDYGPLGAAEYQGVMEERILQLKAMGCNAIRTAHNPFSTEFLDACDRLGMLVMNECFDGWKKKATNDYGAHFFKEWGRRDLTDFVLRDRNHPCVVLWSIGNETGHSDVHQLSELIAELDPSRASTGGRVHSGVDIPGYNGEAGEPKFFATREANPGADASRPVVFTEVPHTYHTRGVYRTQPFWRDGNRARFDVGPLTEKEVFRNTWDAEHDRKVDYFSNYDNAQVRVTIRKSWENTRDHGWIAGEFRWTGHDYLGESFGWPMRGAKNGVIDLCNFPKDVYYLYQSMWSSEPMVHLLPHWTHPYLEEGVEIPVWAYSNCDEVELFFNDKSLGVDRPRTKWDEIQCEWMVAYEPGELKAVGRRDGKIVAEDVVRTAGAPEQLLLESDPLQLSDNGHDLVQVAVAAGDYDGTFAPLASNRVYFHVEGDAQLLAIGNSDSMDHEPTHGASSRRLFFGRAKAYVRSVRGDDAPAYVTVAAILGDRTLMQSKVAIIDVREVRLRGGNSMVKCKIHYTTDGSKPTRTSAAYSDPIPVREGTRVRALVWAEGRELMQMDETFSAANWIEAAPVAAKSSTGKRTEVTDAAFSAHVAGEWITPDGDHLMFWPKGRLVRLNLPNKKKNTLLGSWKYEDPVDEFEDAAMDVDHGEIKWNKGGGVSQLRLMDLERTKLRVTTGDKIEVCRRVSGAGSVE